MRQQFIADGIEQQAAWANVIVRADGGIWAFESVSDAALFCEQEDDSDDEEEELEPQDDYDPTPWCSGCGARRRSDCHCGPIADNE